MFGIISLVPIKGHRSPGRVLKSKAMKDARDEVVKHITWMMLAVVVTSAAPVAMDAPVKVNSKVFMARKKQIA